MSTTKTEHRRAAGVDYTLTRRRVRNINLRVRADGSVAASASPRVPAAVVDAFVASRAGWVASARARAAEHARWDAAADAALPPKAEALAKSQPESDAVTKMCTILNDVYGNGDMDARSVITAAILNSMDDASYTVVKEKLSDDLAKVYKFSRGLKGKKIKPEKKKKFKKIVARNLNEM